MTETRRISKGGWRSACATAAALLACGASIACGGAKRPADPVGAIGASSRADDSRTVQYAFDSLDARPVTSEAMRGKPTVLAFVATWDLSSQAQIDFLVPMSEHDGDRVNYAMVALQEPKDRELVEAFATTLKVRFPVAMADPATIAGGGPFGDVHNIPTVVVLDRRGRIVSKHVGLARSQDVRGALHDL